MNYSGIEGRMTHMMPPPFGPPMGIFEQHNPGPPQEFVQINTCMVDGGNLFGVSTVAFDQQEELFWMGSSGGHLTSYHGLSLQRYTSFQVHKSSSIRQIITVDGRVLSLANDNLRCNAKTGQPLFDINGEFFDDLQCMLMTGESSILMAGIQPYAIEVDIQAQKMLRQVQIEEPGCCLLRHSHNYICCGDTSGRVVMRSPKDLSVQHILNAHNGTLSDFDVHGNTLITCGFSHRMGQLTVDRFLMVYDMRMMRAATPLQLMIEPLLLRFMPTYTDRICVVSQTGQWQLIEQGIMNPASMCMYQVQTEAPITSFDISSSYQAIGFGDSVGYIHLFSSGENCSFNAFSQETDIPTLEQMHNLSITDETTPLSIFPMQYPTNGKLLSFWPDSWCQPNYHEPKPIDDEILRSMKMVQNIGYAPNPGKTHRNQMPYVIKVKPGEETDENGQNSPIGRGDSSSLVPKKYRKVEINYSKLGVEGFDFAFYNKTNFSGLETDIPNAYCNSMLQVLYFCEPLRCALLNHLCEREFCLACEMGFLFHMLDQPKCKNVQASNLLRAFRTVPEASALDLILGEAEENSGTANLPRLIQSWTRFILQQLEVQLSKPHVGEKEREKSSDMEGRKIGKKDLKEGKKEETGKKSLAAADKTGDKPNASLPNRSIISELFFTSTTNCFKCRCGEEKKREAQMSILDLSYPGCKPSESSSEYQITECSFGEVLAYSATLEQNTQTWCEKCSNYQPHVQTRTLQNLPPVLILSCQLNGPRELQFWRAQERFTKQRYAEDQSQKSTVMPTASSTAGVKMCRYNLDCRRHDCHFRHDDDHIRKAAQGESAQNEPEVPEDQLGWVPLSLMLKLNDDGSLSVLQDSAERPTDIPKGYIHYPMLATCDFIKNGKNNGSLVCHINACEAYHQRKERVTCTQWYLVNDFSISPIENYEATQYNLDYRVPCVMVFNRSDILTQMKIPYCNPVKADALSHNVSLVSPKWRHITFTPLGEEEKPGKGYLVGLDAEFVTLNQEEAELKSDGTRSMIKPSQMSVARVTCVRGQGPMEGEPFIDDYICNQEQVVDYLTQFSGIQPGDLDASLSSKHLTTLKPTYLKLRYLVDAGVIFVGHGLKKDFRVINIVVPKAQVIDTVELFHLHRQRMVSLKFLAWFYLGEKIQSETHDSIEDAKTALRLYQCHRKLSEKGHESLAESLRELYESGRKNNWKVPEN